MRKILAEQAFQMTGCTESECAIRAGRLVSAREVLTGSCSIMDGVRIVVARLIEVESGLVVKTAVESGFSVADAGAAAARLVEKLDGSAAQGRGSVIPPVPFEGVLHVANRVFAGGIREAVHSFKGDMFRLEDLGETDSYVLANLKTGKMVLVMKSTSTYMDMNVGSPKPPETVWPAPRPTGLTEIVAGYTCEVWRSSAAQRVVTLWLSKGLGAFWGNGAGVMGPVRAGLDLPAGYFAMRYEISGAGLHDADKFVVTQVEWKSLPGSLFEPPPGFTQKPAPARHK